MARDKIVVFVSFLWIVQSVGRLCFAAVGTPEGMGQFLDIPISPTTSAILLPCFCFWVFRAHCCPWFVSGTEVGFWSAMLTSFATIAFDLWGLAIQFTAALGLIIPVISIITS